MKHGSATIPRLPSARSIGAVHRADPDGALASGRPDACWVLHDDAGREAAGCSAWWTRGPTLPAARVGVIGHYRAAGPAAGQRVVDAACAALAARGCTLAIGPMDGTTWNRYRFVVERGDAPPFWLEPRNPAGWPEQFRAAGFAPIAYYRSALQCPLGFDAALARRLGYRMARAGVRLRTVDGASRDRDLRAIFRVACAAFAKAAFYCPIDETEFLDIYRPVLASVPDDLIWIAEHRERAVGFLVAMPDLSQRDRGEAVDTVIVKTAAVLPGRTFAGLGHLLGLCAAATSMDLGYRRAIHALIHQGNGTSRNLSARYARPIRRYALFARRLAG